MSGQRKVMVVSILMLTVNQKCNAFASIMGIFCHANNTPEKVIEALSRIGVCISIHAIHDAIKSLSAEASEAVREIGQTLTAAYGYDNFDVELKSAVPTAEKGSESALHHLTSGIIFQLPKGTRKEDLRCSKELWERSPRNDEALDDRPNLAPAPVWQNLFTIQPEYHTVDPAGLTSRDRWVAWKYLSDLLENGPEWFQLFRSHLQAPEVIEQVPLEKTRIVPVRAMHINNSTVSGNMEAISNLLAQGGVGDPNEVDDDTLESMLEYVVITHGDLGSGEKIDIGQLRRALEDSPYLRYQFVIFVFGLFHMKMACADTIWRMLIQDRRMHDDETSFMKHAATLRPRETGKILSNPGFRRMHQLITHDGICRRLNCWEVEIQKRFGSDMTLEGFAKKKPTFAQLKDLASHIAMTYVGTPGKLENLRTKPATERDEQYENSLLINEYLLLYEELSYAINHGDIGRVEGCFAPWVCLFKATGKHKYATKITKHTTDVHFFFPEGLK